MRLPPDRQIDLARREASSRLDPENRARLGQFMTPSAVADFMASLFEHWPAHVTLLDPGAGIGSLTDAFAEQFSKQAPQAAVLDAHCYEVESILIDYLADHLRQLETASRQARQRFVGTIHKKDFIADASFQIGMGGQRFTHAILNPPYKKISSDSDHRRILRAIGIETVNLYTAFVALTIELMERTGEIVAIIPRSFCNGTYYRPFRELLLERTAIKQIHVFESRKKAFEDDAVLQENVIIHLVRGAAQGDVTISASHDTTFVDYHERCVPFSQIVSSTDSERFIHIPTREMPRDARLFAVTLEELGLSVSTGPVVDFRLKEYWLSEPSGDCVPLLYSHHFREGAFSWPKKHKKPNALMLCPEVRKWLFPRGCYTITKRFSAKEERRRLVAYVVDPAHLPYHDYGFENHLNVFHCSRQGLTPALAHGLALFLNSTVADLHFRSFSGHTQVNATDLRTMKYPDKGTLENFGNWALAHGPLSQEEIDHKVEGHGPTKQAHR